MFSGMWIERAALPPLLGDVWELRRNMRITDGFYVALARSRDIPLVTTDRRLGRFVTDRRLCEVVVIE